MTNLIRKILQAARDGVVVVNSQTGRSKRHVQADMDVRAIRLGLGMKQAEFAATFGIPIGTLSDWERRRTVPDMAVRSYLLVIERRPEAVREALTAARKGGT